jgi:hypothetical protein
MGGRAEEGQADARQQAHGAVIQGHLFVYAYSDASIAIDECLQNRTK